MLLIDRLESKLGRFAIPGIIQAIAVLQIFAFVIFVFLPTDARQPYQDFLMLKRDLVLQGQVWRLFTYIFIPSSSVLVAVIGGMFMMWTGRGLEEAWGSFRVNLYIIGGLFSIAIGAIVFGYEPNLEIMGSRGGSVWLYLSVLFGFAMIYPNEEVLLFFILPVKIKWLALFSAGILVLAMVSDPEVLIPTFFALLNFGIAFGPDFIKGRMHTAKVASRKSKFEEATAGAAFFHQCKICGKTEVDDRTLSFRVTDDGDEICSTCRKLG